MLLLSILIQGSTRCTSNKLMENSVWCNMKISLLWMGVNALFDTNWTYMYFHVWRPNFKSGSFFVTLFFSHQWMITANILRLQRYNCTYVKGNLCNRAIYEVSRHLINCLPFLTACKHLITIYKSPRYLIKYLNN